MKTALIFPGQGSQSVGMGKDLQQNFSQAKEVFDEINDILGLNLTKIMFEGPTDELIKTENAQPALMAVSIALIRVMQKEFGVNLSDICSYVAGHSLGEYSALCAADSLTLKQTARLLKIRGKAMANCAAQSEGAMAAILGLEIESVEELVKISAQNDTQNDICQVANDNSTGQIVISGHKSAIIRATEKAKEFGAKRAIILPVGGAFHSQLMIEAQNEMQKALSNVEIAKPIVPLIANVTADIVDNAGAIRELLIRQVTGSVRWRESLILMKNSGVEQVIEIGCGKVLCGLTTKTCPDIKTISIQNSEDLKSFASNV